MTLMPLQALLLPVRCSRCMQRTRVSAESQACEKASLHFDLPAWVTLEHRKTLTMFPHSEPNVPDLPGMDAFPGRQLHCHNFRTPAAFTGETVMVVGASFSGEPAPLT